MKNLLLFIAPVITPVILLLIILIYSNRDCNKFTVVLVFKKVAKRAKAHTLSTPIADKLVCVHKYNRFVNIQSDITKIIFPFYIYLDSSCKQVNFPVPKTDIHGV